MPRFCPDCGNRMKNDRAAFCDECGAKLPSQALPPSLAAERVVREAREKAQASQPQQGGGRPPQQEAGKLDFATLAKTAAPAGIILGVLAAALDAIPPIVGSLFFQSSYTLILSVMQYVMPFVVFIIGMLAGFAAFYMFKILKVAMLPDVLRKHQFYSGITAGALVGALAAFTNFLFPIADIVSLALSPTTPGLKITLINALMVVIVFILTLLLGAVGGALAGSYSHKLVA